MTAVEFDEAKTSDLLNRAALFRVLAQGFAYPSPERYEEVASAFGKLSGADGVLGEALAEAMTSWREADSDSLAASYNSLFFGEAHCSLHETAYGDGKRIAGRPAELADIAGFYRAFGLSVSDSNPDIPDHLCAELEFYSILLIKQSYALSEGQAENFDITEQAAKAFMEQHLGRWIGALTAGMEEHNTPKAYLALARLVQRAVEREVDTLGVTITPVEGKAPKDPMHDDELICPRDVPEPAVAG